ncbi:unnamed protein product, partial [Phaeothamnion confervicola]
LPLKRLASSLAASHGTFREISKRGHNLESTLILRRYLSSSTEVSWHHCRVLRARPLHWLAPISCAASSTPSVDRWLLGSQLRERTSASSVQGWPERFALPSSSTAVRPCVSSSSMSRVRRRRRRRRVPCWLLEALLPARMRCAACPAMLSYSMTVSIRCGAMRIMLQSAADRAMSAAGAFSWRLMASDLRRWRRQRAPQTS